MTKLAEVNSRLEGIKQRIAWLETQRDTWRAEIAKSGDYNEQPMAGILAKIDRMIIECQKTEIRIMTTFEVRPL